MTIQDYARILRDRWIVVTAVALLGLLTGVAFFVVRPPTYSANVSLYVSAQSGSDPQQAFQGAQLSEQRVKSYSELVTSTRVLDETSRRLDFPNSISDLASAVSASNTTDSVIISISADDRSPSRATAIANTVAVVTTEVVAELERPTSPNGVPPVAVRIVQPASEPSSPSSMGIGGTLLLGLVLGLALGIGAAFLRNATDTSIKSDRALAELTGSPTLGTLAKDPNVSMRPLTVQDDPQSPRAEAFRQLRTNLQFLDVDDPRRVLVVTSSMPGEGKTTTVANLAITLAAAGALVLVIEADLRRPRLSHLLGLDRSVGLTTALAGRRPATDSIQAWSGGAFDVMSSGPTPPNPSELLSSHAMRSIIKQMRSTYDYVLIDTPPLLPVTDAAAIAPSADGIVLLCQYKRTTQQQLEAAISALSAVSAGIVGTILTMVDARSPIATTKYRKYYQAGEYETARDAAPAIRHEPAAASQRTVEDRTERLQERRSRTAFHGGATSRGESPQ